MICTRAAMALVLSLCWAQQGAGQSVYRCEKDGQTVFSQQPCDEATTEAAVAEKRRQSEIEAEAERILQEFREQHERERRAEGPIRMERRSCIKRDTGTLEAIVEVVNETNEDARLRLTIHFVRGDRIIGVEKPSFVVTAGGSETISRLGPLREGGDRCEYELEAYR